MTSIHIRPVQKGLNVPDNHNGVITHLEPDIPEYEVKWALGSIATNKASGGDGILAKLFQILKDEARSLRKAAAAAAAASASQGPGRAWWRRWPCKSKTTAGPAMRQWP